jgi:predicted transcriptional regulator
VRCRAVALYRRKRRNERKKRKRRKMFLDLMKRDGIKNPGIDLNKLMEDTPKLLV